MNDRAVATFRCLTLGERVRGACNTYLTLHHRDIAARQKSAPWVKSDKAAACTYPRCECVRIPMEQATALAAEQERKRLD